MSGWQQAVWVPTFVAVAGVVGVFLEAITQESPRISILSLFGLMIFGPAGFIADRLRGQTNDKGES